MHKQATQQDLEDIAVHRHQERLIQVLADHARDVLDIAEIDDVAVRSNDTRDGHRQLVVVTMQLFSETLQSIYKLCLVLLAKGTFFDSKQ